MIQERHCRLHSYLGPFWLKKSDSLITLHFNFNLAQMNRIIAYCLFIGTSLSLNAQKIENVRATSTDDQIIVTYDLIGATEGQEFRIQLYSSVDNFKSALIKVTGDIGNRIPSGKQRRIIWNSKEELNNLKAEVILEVRGEALAPIVTPVEKPVTSTAPISPYKGRFDAGTPGH